MGLVRNVLLLAKTFGIPLLVILKLCFHLVFSRNMKKNMYVHLPTSQKYEKRFGNRVSVWEETAFETSSGLRKEDLKENRRGRVVSKRRSSLMLERYKKFGGLRNIP